MWTYQTKGRSHSQSPCLFKDQVNSQTLFKTGLSFKKDLITLMQTKSHK
jgi:hypothetical protein